MIKVQTQILAFLQIISLESLIPTSYNPLLIPTYPLGSIWGRPFFEVPISLISWPGSITDAKHVLLLLSYLSVTLLISPHALNNRYPPYTNII